MKTLLGTIDIGSRTFTVFVLPSSAKGIKKALVGHCLEKRIDEYIADFKGLHPRLLGQVDYELQFITITAVGSPQQFAETLYHEIGHAVAWVLGDPTNNEALAAFYSHFIRRLVPELIKVADGMLLGNIELQSIMMDELLEETKSFVVPVGQVLPPGERS